ncbi:hypothetical protein MSPP1_000103 [Malassezia sp. CBS 17886]|nr:hypothetical protein MSPP1_000103 [Malassezia sp. CBS 17886]
MIGDNDPAALFFPETESVDLYGVLGLRQKDAPSTGAIRKAYRTLALRYHPDKAALHGEENAALRFQQVGFAYSVLSDERWRKRYDSTGATSDPLGDADGPVDWNEYFKTLWTGEVNARTLADFESKYKGSEEEREDVLKAYRDRKGSLEGIFASVPCASILEDEKRFIGIIDAAIDAGDIAPTRAWKSLRTAEGKRVRKQLRAKAKDEAVEAEEYAKELGVFDTLYRGDKQLTEDKKKRKSPSAGSAQPAGGDDEEVDLDAIRAAMRTKNAKKANAFDDMISRLEAQHGTAPSPGTKKAKAHRLKRG